MIPTSHGKSGHVPSWKSIKVDSIFHNYPHIENYKEPLIRTLHKKLPQYGCKLVRDAKKKLIFAPNNNTEENSQADATEYQNPPNEGKPCGLQWPPHIPPVRS